MDKKKESVWLTPEDLVPASKLARSVGSFLDSAKERPLFITRGQEIDAVLIGLDDYRTLLHELDSLEDLSDTLTAMKRYLNYLMSEGKTTCSMEELMAQAGITQAEVDQVPLDDLDD